MQRLQLSASSAALVFTWSRSNVAELACIASRASSNEKVPAYPTHHRSGNMCYPVGTATLHHLEDVESVDQTPDDEGGAA